MSEHSDPEQGAKSEESFPRILVFCCNWCSYAGADLAGTSRLKLPPTFRTVRVMCSGRVDMLHVLYTLAIGADGVLVSGCHLGDCHYLSGNYKAVRRMQFLKDLLTHFGLGERVGMVHVSAGEGHRFREVITDFSEKIRDLGPSPLRKATFRMSRDGDKRRMLLDILAHFIEVLALTKKGGIDVRLEDMPVGFGEPVYDVDRCVGCGACVHHCPMGNIDMIDREGRRSIAYFHTYCVGCGICEETCPEKAIIVKKHMDLESFLEERQFTPVIVELESCQECGKNYVPTRQLQHLREKIGELADELPLSLCPDCRRMREAVQIKQHLFSARPNPS